MQQQHLAWLDQSYQMGGQHTRDTRLPRQRRGLATLLKSAALIRWDEASMAKRKGIEALDKLLRDLTEVDSLFVARLLFWVEIFDKFYQSYLRELDKIV